MSKKLSLPKKGKTTKLGDPPPTRIRETLVGDPSINFTVALDPNLELHDGYYVVDFRVQVWLNDVPASSTRFINVANVHIKSLSMLDPYFYLPFGDPDYGAGQEFKMRLKLSGRHPITRRPMKFNDNGNWFEQTLIGGGIKGESSGKPKKNGRKK